MKNDEFQYTCTDKFDIMTYTFWTQQRRCIESWLYFVHICVVVVVVSAAANAADAAVAAIVVVVVVVVVVDVVVVVVDEYYLFITGCIKR